MKQFYHIICGPDLDEGLCDIPHIPSACTRYLEQPPNPWLPNLDKTIQPRYDIKP